MYVFFYVFPLYFCMYNFINFPLFYVYFFIGNFLIYFFCSFSYIFFRKISFKQHLGGDHTWAFLASPAGGTRTRPPPTPTPTSPPHSQSQRWPDDAPKQSYFCLVCCGTVDGGGFLVLADSRHWENSEKRTKKTEFLCFYSLISSLLLAIFYLNFLFFF